MYSIPFASGWGLIAYAAQFPQAVYYGRFITVMWFLINFIFIIYFLNVALFTPNQNLFSKNLWDCVGFFGWGFTVAIPMYVSEITDDSLRGALGSCMVLMIV